MSVNQVIAAYQSTLAGKARDEFIKLPQEQQIAIMKMHNFEPTELGALSNLALKNATPQSGTVFPDKAVPTDNSSGLVLEHTNPPFVEAKTNVEVPKTTQYVAQVGDKIEDVVKKSLVAQGKEVNDSNIKAATEKFLKDNHALIRHNSRGTFINAGSTVTVDGKVDLGPKTAEEVKNEYKNKYGEKTEAQKQAEVQKKTVVANAPAKVTGKSNNSPPPSKVVVKPNSQQVPAKVVVKPGNLQVPVKVPEKVVTPQQSSVTTPGIPLKIVPSNPPKTFTFTTNGKVAPPQQDKVKIKAETEADLQSSAKTVLKNDATIVSNANIEKGIKPFSNPNKKNSGVLVPNNLPPKVSTDVKKDIAVTTKAVEAKVEHKVAKEESFVPPNANKIHKETNQKTGERIITTLDKNGKVLQKDLYNTKNGSSTTEVYKNDQLVQKQINHKNGEKEFFDGYNPVPQGGHDFTLKVVTAANGQKTHYQRSPDGKYHPIR